MADATYRPAGWPALIPRIAVDDPEALVTFIKHVFGATGDFSPRRPSELRIGDSMLMVGSTIDRSRGRWRTASSSGPLTAELSRLRSHRTRHMVIGAP
jgi:uncharacterized glyoxalase superfamily protein PhnB